jgi:FAD/FMN-containing dehydrogenase
MTNSTSPASEPAVTSPPQLAPREQPAVPQQAGPEQALRRRGFLVASGAVGAVAVAGGLLGPAAAAAAASTRHARGGAAQAARPAWLSGGSTSPTTADWNALRNKLSTHKLYRPGESGYNFAKELFSPQFDSLKPSGVGYCKTTADVAACLSFVTKFKMPVRMRSGGHSYGGWSSVTNGFILDISEMNSMSFGNGTVTVGTGIDRINFYAGLAAKGKAVPGGSCPTVGIAGLTLGGGIGIVGRKYGLTCDDLRSIDIVTADGVKHTCDPGHDSALYWASRGGGGGNFGVATSMTFTTHNLTSIVLFFLHWHWSEAARVINAWQSWAPHAPADLWSNLLLSASFGSAPSSVFVGGSWIGSIGGAQAQLDKLYHMVGTAPYSHSLNRHSYLSAMMLEAGCSNVSVHACDTPPNGNLPRVPFYAKSDFFNKPFDSHGIAALISGIERLQHISGASGGAGSIAFDALGGAVNNLKPDATAFVHRDQLFDAQYYTGWNWPGTATGRANQFNWLTSFHNSIHPYGSGQAYQNYPDPTLSDWAQQYYAGNYPQLQQVKATYDPHNLFNFPQSIRPPSTGSCDSPDC